MSAACLLCIPVPLPAVQRASVTTEVISATLNAGQAIILSVGLTAALCLAARGGASAAGMVVTAGDLVSVYWCQGGHLYSSCLDGWPC